MSIEKISIRLGMNQGLYIGICIGVIVTALIILFECWILSLGITHVLAASLALLCAALLVIGIICMVQNREFRSSDQICTCRYRSSLSTMCRQCALYPRNDPGSDDESVPGNDDQIRQN